jgi:hypothetical protein
MYEFGDRPTLELALGVADDMVQFGIQLIRPWEMERTGFVV